MVRCFSLDTVNGTGTGRNLELDCNDDVNSAKPHRRTGGSQGIEGGTQGVNVITLRLHWRRRTRTRSMKTGLRWMTGPGAWHLDRICSNARDSSDSCPTAERKILKSLSPPN